jgi:hypothetical protein
VTDTTNFLGLTIDGDIMRHGKQRDQITKEQFADLVKALLDDDNVIEFGWRQYTPYFNDGEPCVFSANGLWIRTTADRDVEVEDGDTLSMWSHPTLSDSRWEGNKRVTHEVQFPATAAAATALDSAIDGGVADAVLLDLFGDHADVKVTRDGITVEYYEHD